MRELEEKIARATGYAGRLLWDTSQPNGQPRRMLDVSLTRERFGFAATTSLDDGIARTIAWFSGNQADIRLREASAARR